MTAQQSELKLVQRILRVGVVIPVYGENNSVQWILERFREHHIRSITTICLVVDVPKKGTTSSIKQAAAGCGITVHIIKNGTRTGVGASIRQGLKYLSETGHNIVVIMAGNMKDDPAEIDRLISPVLRGECDYVQGSRYVLGGIRTRMPLVRILFNRLYPMLWTLFTQRKCTDVTNGYRCYRLDLLNDPRINIDQDWLVGYSLEYYIHYKILTLGYETKEVPVSKKYPFGHKGGYSKIQPLKDWWPIISPLALLFLGVRE